MSDPVYEGACSCGAVRLTVRGAPEAAGYCHCDSCRRWSAGPVNAFTLWRPDAVEVTAGEDRLATWQKTPRSLRRWCTACGGHVFTEHPEWQLIDVFAAVIPDFPFQPGVHVHYGESVLPIRDGLPKQRDLPAEMGGSGELVEE